MIYQALSFVVSLLIFGIANQEILWLSENESIQTNATVINAVKPMYPPVAAAQKIEGIVQVEVKMNTEGKVTNAKIINGPKRLRKVAQEASLKWQFNTVASDTGQRLVRLSFHFCLSRKDECAGTEEFIRPYRMIIRWDPTLDHFNR